MDSLLGLVLLVLYVVGMVTLAGLVTLAAIKIFPTKDRSSKKPDDDGTPPTDDGSAAGRLFRRAKREATG